MLKKPLPTKLVSESVLAALVEAGAIHTVYLVEDSGGDFHIVARSTDADYRIEKKRRGVRTFRDLRRAAELVRGMGIAHIRLHLNEHTPSIRTGLA